MASHNLEKENKIDFLQDSVGSNMSDVINECPLI